MATLVAPAPRGGEVPPPSGADGRYYSMVVGEGTETIGDPGGSLLVRRGQVWVSSDLSRGRPLQASTGPATVRWRRAGLLITAAAGSSVVIVATGRATLTVRGKKTVVRGGTAVRILPDGTIDQKEPVRRDELLADPWLASASGLPHEQQPTRHGGRVYLAGAVFFALAASAVAVAPRVLNSSGRTTAGAPTAQSTPQTVRPVTGSRPSVTTPSATLAPSLAGPPPTTHTTLPGSTGSTKTSGSSASSGAAGAGGAGTTPKPTTATSAPTTTTTTTPVRAATPVSASTPNGATVTMQSCAPNAGVVTATGTASGPAGASATVTISFVTAGGTQLPTTVKTVVFTGTPVAWTASAPLPVNSGGGRCWATIKS